MGQYTYQLHTSIKDVDKKQNITLQAEKGRGNTPSVYLSIDDFSLLEGVLWDNYREYGNIPKNKIRNDDCERIIIGFKETIDELKSVVTEDDLYRILRARNKNSFPLSTLLQEKNQLIPLYQEVTTWIEEAIKENKYIIVINKS